MQILQDFLLDHVSETIYTQETQSTREVLNT